MWSTAPLWSQSVRSVEVKPAHWRILTRPVGSLYPLELDVTDLPPETTPQSTKANDNEKRPKRQAAIPGAARVASYTNCVSVLPAIQIVLH